jgi:hypothetical protein
LFSVAAGGPVFGGLGLDPFAGVPGGDGHGLSFVG